MSDAGRPINDLTEKSAEQIADTDRLIGHDAGNPAAFRSAVDQVRRVMWRNESGVSFYSDGSFTPTLSGAGSSPSVTYGSRGASYVRVGALVTVGLSLATTARSGGSGVIVINGLPFTVATIAGGSVAGGGAEMRDITLDGNVVDVSLVPIGGTNGLQVIGSVSDGALVGIPITGWGSTGRIRATFSYFTDFANPL